MKKKLTLDQDCGFTLLETLVALSIFAFVSAGVATSFISNLRLNKQAELRGGAIMVAQQVLDELRSQDPTTLLSTGSDASRSVAVGNKTFTVDVSYCNPSTYCTSTSIRAIHVAVYYKGVSQYAVDTVFSQLR